MVDKFDISVARTIISRCRLQIVCSLRDSTLSFFEISLEDDVAYLYLHDIVNSIALRLKITPESMIRTEKGWVLIANERMAG